MRKYPSPTPEQEARIQYAEALTRTAQAQSKLCSLWLEHPFVAHAAHEQAASAWENAGNQTRAAEHQRAARYWAKKELEWNSNQHKLRQNAKPLPNARRN